jgi:hypothetical protein
MAVLLIGLLKIFYEMGSTQDLLSSTFLPLSNFAVAVIVPVWWIPGIPLLWQLNPFCLIFFGLGLLDLCTIYIQQDKKKWSRTSGLRTMFRDCSLAVYVASISRSSGLASGFPRRVHASWPAYRQACPPPFDAQLPGQTMTGLGVEATVALGRATLLCVTTRDRSILLPALACTVATTWPSPCHS